ncbi:mitochondrial ribosomal subunit S18 protein [Rutstroemia sp. NJR-2017a WRK4]|nr:mitochondrial ribosomal subunit S18 protein [Rutstroemia sp. NJR-2017a WRK4]PQE14771.1 mitochondrial ribosomal subunit S18 protein [Rutstroemia sp. NJR-2017a WRK4]
MIRREMGLKVSATSPSQTLRCARPFSSTSQQKADGDDISSLTPPGPSRSTPPQTDRNATRAVSPQSRSKPAAAGMSELAGIFAKLSTEKGAKPTKLFGLRNPEDDDGTLIGNNKGDAEPYHFHVYATRHNTHITLTKPDRTPIISLSCGNIGFRHSGRKHYDSAFQLASLVMARIHERAINREIHALELVLRGFGAGREAVTKALMGTEGRLLRGKVVKVTDATRLKFGGTRSPKPRRLG